MLGHYSVPFLSQSKTLNKMIFRTDSPSTVKVRLTTEEVVM